MFDFLTPEKATLVAQETHLLGILLAIAGIIAVALVYIAIYRTAFKYKRGSDADRSQQPAESSRRQLAYVAILAVVFLLIFVLSADTYLRAVSPPENALEITAIGKQWMWKFQHYPDGQREINELHVPIGRPIKLTMTSQDTEHSLFIPALGVKQAVMPNHYTSAWFEVTTVLTKPGAYKAYRLAGGEYNGTAYSQMVGQVIALSPADYKLWLEGEYVLGGAEVELTPVEKGKALFESNGCTACHKDDGSGIGPWFADRYGTTIDLEGGGSVTVDDAYLHESIVDPGAKVVSGYPPVMPSFTSLKDEELADLITYIKSLSGVVEEGGAAGGEAGPAAPAEMPEAYFMQGCVGCHGATLEGGVGPILGGLDPDYIKANVREGNLDVGMSAYDKSQIKDKELEQIALYINAATLQDAGVTLSDDIKDALTQAQEALQAKDKDAVEKQLNNALTAAVMGKSPVGVQNTFKFMINRLANDNWADYTQNRLDFLLAEGEGTAAPAETSTETTSDTAESAATAAPADAAETEVAADNAETGGAAAELPPVYFMQGCVGCHGKQLEGGVGPVLAGLPPDFIKANVREGNMDFGMTAYDETMISESDLDAMAQTIQAYTLADTGVEFSNGVQEAFKAAQSAAQSGDKAAAESALNDALTASVMDKAPIGVQNTIKTLINALKEDGWEAYLDGRMKVYLGAEDGAASSDANAEPVAEAPAATPAPPEPTATAIPPTPTAEATATPEPAPTATAVPPTAAPVPAAALSIIFPANNADIIVGRLGIIGSSEAGTEIELSDNGSVIGSAVTDAAGEWIFVTAVEQKGAHQLTAKPTGAGAGESVTINVVAATDSYNCASNPGINRGDTYIVGTCDTLGSLTQAEVEALLAANPQIENPDLIYPGDILKWP